MRGDMISTAVMRAGIPEIRARDPFRQLGNHPSCPRDNFPSQRCPVVALDVEDLGRYFEPDRVATNGSRKWTMSSSEEVPSHRGSPAVRYKSDIFPRGSPPPRNTRLCSPSERMWANMKEASMIDQEPFEDGFPINESVADPSMIIYNQGSNFGCSNPNQIDPTDRFPLVPWNGGEIDLSRPCPFGQQFYQQPRNQFEGENSYQRIEPLDPFCPEFVWLRCQAPQCPLIDNNYPLGMIERENVVQRSPVQHQYSKKNSELTPFHYYGEDIGYFTPAEYNPQNDDDYYLSNEKRKEKSRDAARYRRSRETNIFSDLGKALPISIDQVAQLDKASIMRLAIAYLKVRTVIDAIPEPLAKPEPSPEMDGLFLKALDGFMLVLSSDGDMVYLSENVSEYLGVSQMDMMGQNVYDYSHPCDHDELRECLSMKPVGIDENETCNLFLRLKCTLTSKGRKVNLKSASYKVIHCIGHIVATPRDLSTPVTQGEDNGLDDDESEDSSEPSQRQETGVAGCLVLVGCPIPHPSNIEVPLGRHTFLSKHSLNMKFTYADEKLAEYLGWDTNELVGQSVFEFHHALDNLVLDKSFKSLFSKGQCETPAYRFLGKKGGYAWVVTQATLIHCAKQHKPLSVVCVNYILSEIECENEVYSGRQLEARCSVDASEDTNKQPSSAVVPSSVDIVATAVALLKNNNCSNEIADIEGETTQLLKTANDATAIPVVSIPVPIQERPRPLSVTASLFRPHDKPQKEVLASKKVLDNQKVSAKPVSITKQIFASKTPTTKSQPGPKKENQQPLRNRNNQVIGLPHNSHQDSIFHQSKPAPEYSALEQQRTRPQAVTRSLFAPAPQPQEPPPSRPPPQTATASIFAPRTKDMNKGFLTFSEDQSGLTMLKDEPEDLTHLAPTAGDVCVPLEDPPFLSDMLDEFILENDNYCPLLSPGLPTELRVSEIGDSLKESELEESLRNGELAESLADSDPFMYRDSPSPCSASPNLLSPSLSKSPGSIDSLCSPSGSGCGLSEDEMLMLSISDVLADDELALRAPYIPMSDQDEALQLLISDDMVMWSPSQPPDKKSKWSSNGDCTTDSNIGSSLEQLLRTNSANLRKCNDHGGGLIDPTDALGNAYKKNIKDDSSWIIKSERSQKRVHCTNSIFDGDNKRIKCEERIGNKTACSNEDTVNLANNGRGNSGLSSQQGSHLLQQLMSSQNSPVSNAGADHTSRPNEGGGGGGGSGSGSDESSSLPMQQSNSVLMNLLVSGCDVRAGYICLTKQNKPSKSSIASQ